jgi:glycosyltransferase involved in cell wall biosynthesis
MEGLRERGHEVRCLTSTWTDGSFEKEIERLGIGSTSLPLGFISKTMSMSAFRMTLGQLIRLPLLWVGYRQALQEFGPDVVVHSAIHHTFLLCPAFGREKNVFHVHDNFVPKRFYRVLFGLLNKRIDCFIAVSNFVAEGLRNLGIKEAKITTVLNGSLVFGTNSGTPECLLPKDSSIIRLGIVGQVADWKGHAVLIEALNILKRKKLPFVCRIFGDGDSGFRTRLKSKINEYGLGQMVEWQGFISDRVTIYHNIDICLIPSTFSEPFGMVAAEAATFGLPVIASRIGGLPEVVLDRKTGLLVEAGSSEELAATIYSLSKSSELRRELGEGGINFVANNLSANRMTAEVEAVFRRLQT